MTEYDDSYNKIREEAYLMSPLGSRLNTLANGIESTRAASGEIWECGCNKGWTARFMRACIADTKRALRLFDTFEGLPYHGEFDRHGMGAMRADYEKCKVLFDDLSGCFIHKGIMPASFEGLENCVISVAHIDVDQYRSVKECLEWIYPRVHSKGWIVIDDYNCGDCPGAKKAVDDFLIGKSEILHKGGAGNPQVYFTKI